MRMEKGRVEKRIEVRREYDSSYSRMDLCFGLRSSLVPAYEWLQMVPQAHYPVEA